MRPPSMAAPVKTKLWRCRIAMTTADGGGGGQREEQADSGSACVQLRCPCPRWTVQGEGGSGEAVVRGD